MVKPSELAAEDRERAEADEEFKRNWEKDQRAVPAYQHIYREADVRQRVLANQTIDESGRIPGVQPGHDPTLQAQYLRDEGKERNVPTEQGSDNLPPHLTTADSSATSRPDIGAETGDANLTVTATTVETGDKEKEAEPPKGKEPPKAKEREDK